MGPSSCLPFQYLRKGLTSSACRFSTSKAPPSTPHLPLVRRVESTMKGLRRTLSFGKDRKGAAAASGAAAPTAPAPVPPPPLQTAATPEKRSMIRRTLSWDRSKAKPQSAAAAAAAADPQRTAPPAESKRLTAAEFAAGACVQQEVAAPPASAEAAAGARPLQRRTMSFGRSAKKPALDAAEPATQPQVANGGLSSEMQQILSEQKRLKQERAAFQLQSYLEKMSEVDPNLDADADVRPSRGMPGVRADDDEGMRPAQPLQGAHEPQDGRVRSTPVDVSDQSAAEEVPTDGDGHARMVSEVDDWRVVDAPVAVAAAPPPSAILQKRTLNLVRAPAATDVASTHTLPASTKLRMLRRSTDPAPDTLEEPKGIGNDALPSNSAPATSEGASGSADAAIRKEKAAVPLRKRLSFGREKKTKTPPVVAAPSALGVKSVPGGNPTPRGNAPQKQFPARGDVMDDDELETYLRDLELNHDRARSEFETFARGVDDP